MFNGPLNADSRTTKEIRAKNKERLEMIRSGDISEAMRSMTDAEKGYAEMRDMFNAWRGTVNDLSKALGGWTETVRSFESNRKSSVSALERFGRFAEALMGDSLRVVLEECEAEVSPDDVNVVTDDAKWAALIGRIATADTLNALKMTKAAYKIALESVGSFSSKCLSLKRRADGNGSTDAEKASAEALLMRTTYALDVIKKRKDVLVETNLKLRASIAKFMEKNKAEPKSVRDLTEEEKEILKGLI